MSGPVRATDAPIEPDDGEATGPVVDVAPSHEARVGDQRVRRALPQRSRRTVGAWCFADHMGPADVDADAGPGIGPHPHIGLQTVTWLVDGELLHRDSLGSEQTIRPGQLNLMTAGRGVAHAEEGTGRRGQGLHGIQLWVAQPDATRHGDPAFEHHADLPRVDVGTGTATVLVGALGDAASPARRDTDHLGVDLDLRGGSVVLPTDPAHEHALVVLAGRVVVEGRAVEPGALAYLGSGRDELPVDAPDGARAILLGGSPFEARVKMWWNFVARNLEEIDAARDAWAAGDERFGPTGSSLATIPAPVPPWRAGPA